MRIYLHMNHVHRELEFGTAEPDVLCCVYKLQETWNGKCELLEEPNVKLLEARDGDPTNDCFYLCKR
jgi:hypothetical protein